jgi:hypothetical protein
MHALGDRHGRSGCLLPNVHRLAVIKAQAHQRLTAGSIEYLNGDVHVRLEHAEAQDARLPDDLEHPCVLVFQTGGGRTEMIAYLLWIE